jgi:hypothetical protein
VGGVGTVPGDGLVVEIRRIPAQFSREFAFSLLGEAACVGFPVLGRYGPGGMTLPARWLPSWCGGVLGAVPYARVRLCP